MNIWYHHYFLEPRVRSLAYFQKKKAGLLIRIETKTGAFGFGDCHPLIEWGDEPVPVQLEKLRNGIPTRLMQSTLKLAEIDANARAKEINLLENRTLPLNHKLFVQWGPRVCEQLQEAEQNGFNTFKLKLDPGIVENCDQLNETFRNLKTESRIRLDFNETLTKSQYDIFVDRLSEQSVGQIDFVEDPFDYDQTYLANKIDSTSAVTRRIRLALDRHFLGDLSHPNGIGVYSCLVYKAVRNLVPPGKLKSLLNSFRLVFTSTMDHPLGQMAALYWASEFKLAFPQWTETCGLLTHEFFEGPFCEAINSWGPQIKPPEGTGFGFDQLLNSLDWKRLQ